MRQSLREFLSALDECQERVPLAELIDRLRGLDLSLEDVRDFVRFGARTYQRNLMHAGPGYHALILCWRSGQRSPIHDHRGSSCGVRVLAGEAVETIFERSPEGHVFPTRTRTLRAGEVCGSQDDDIHQVSNLQPASADLVTLHVYSPPLHAMRTFSLMDSAVGEFRDEVMMLDGAGI